MKKYATDNVFDKIISEVSDVAERKVTEEDSYEKAIIGKGSNKSVGICQLARTETNLYCEKNQEIPSIYYVSHEASDGLIASKSLTKAIKQDEGLGTPIHNPKIDGKKIESYIKRKAIKKVGLDEGIISHKSVSMLHTIYTAVAALWVVIQAIHTIIEIVNTGDAITKVISTFGMWYWVAFAMFFLLFVVGSIIVVFKYRNNQEEIINQVNVAVNKMSDEQFLNFLELFSAEDFDIEDCKSSQTENPVFICSLRSYYFRERYILKNYLSGVAHKQLWWVFFEKDMREDFLLERSKNERQIKYFRMSPLTILEKKKLIEKFDASRMGESLDVGSDFLRKRGVDYIYRNTIRVKKSGEDTDISIDFVNEFIKEHERKSAHIDDILRLISELEFNFCLDLKNENIRRDLLRYEYIDEHIYNEVSFSPNEFKDMITEIIDKFDGCYRDVLLLFENKERFSGYDEWCIAQALKIRKPEEDCIDAIAHHITAIYGKFEENKEYEYLQNDVWLEIFLCAAEFFEKQKMFWFLPSIMHYILNVFEKPVNTGFRGRKIFSLPKVLDLAKNNLLLGLSDGVSGDEYVSGTDVIRDHYRVVVKAVEEEKPKFDFDNNNHKSPESFSILRLTPNERQRYFNALRALNKNGEEETSIEKYYSYIFDVYCVTLKDWHDEIKFLYAGFDDEIDNRYFKNSRSKIHSSGDYIKNILKCFIDLLKNELVSGENGFDDSYQKEKIEGLEEKLNNGYSRRAEQDLTYMFAEFDIYGLETYSFIACFIDRLYKIEGDIKDIYLNFNNYLLGLVFLTYHECNQPSLLNDDFRHLVTIIEGYFCPGQVVLGFISCCLLGSMTNTCRECLIRYLSAYNSKEIYVKELSKVAKQVKGPDVSAFIQFVECDPILNEEDKRLLVEVLDSRVSDFEKLEYYFCLKEYFSLLLRNQSVEEFENESPDVNVERLLRCPSNIVVLILACYLNACCDKYIHYFPVLADKILESSLIPLRYVLIFEYLKRENDRKKSNYLSTVETMYKHKKRVLSTNLRSLQVFKDFINLLSEEKNTNPNLYEWISCEEVYSDKNEVQTEVDKITALEAEDKLSVRLKFKYGMLLFLRVLLNNNFENWLIDDEYEKCETREQKINYILNSYSEIQPLFMKDGKFGRNVAYCDMINFIVINEGNIQSLQSEKAWLQRFTRDAEEIMDKAEFADRESEKKIKGLIRAYSSMVERLND